MMLSALKRFGVLTLIVAVIVISVTVPIVAPNAAPSAKAHNWDWCGDQVAIRWSGTSVSHGSPSTWHQSYHDAIAGATTQFNKSDFDYYIDSYSSATVPWQDLNNSDVKIAGAADIWVDCSLHRIQAAWLYFNFPHYYYSGHTVAQKQCTAIHEMGHGVGFHHNYTTSILYRYHSTRCHDWLITSLQSHDYNDINYRY